MHEPDAPAWVSECVRRIGEGRLVMTQDEKARSAERLSKLIMAFFDEESMSTNQEAIEILGIATMYYHAFVYVAGLSKIREKP